MTITFSWIKTTKNKFQPFVERRVNKIHELSDTSIWRHVSTSIISEDLISRGCLVSKLSVSRFWLDGPTLLCGDFGFDNIGVQRLDHKGCSIDALLGFNERCLLVQENSKTDLKFMRLERYGSYIRSISITALVLRFTENLKRKN